MTSESLIQKQIMVGLSKAGHTVFRANVGTVRTADGRIFKTGLPKGFSDLFGVTKTGKPFFIEVKNETGRVRAEQIKFLEVMKGKGAFCGVARSAKEALEIVNDNKRRT